MTVRWVLDMLEELPHSARIWQHLTEGAFTSDQHMQANVVDILASINYNVSISAAAAVGKEWESLQNHRPTPIERPGIKPKEDVPKPREELEFTSTKKAMNIFGTPQQRSVKHLEGCGHVANATVRDCDCPVGR